MKICYCRDNAEHATSILRYILPATFMAEYGGVDVSMTSKVEFSESGAIVTKEVRDADIVIMGQVIYPKDLEIAKMLKKRGKKLVIDADDLYFENGYKHFDEETIAACKEIARLADLVTVCSPYLGEMYHKFAKVPYEKIKYIPNYTICSDWDYWWKKKASQREKNKKDGVVKIGMMGSTHHTIDWLNIYPVVEKVVKKYGDRVSIEIMGMPKDPVAFVLNNNNASQIVLNSAVKSFNLYKDLGAKFLEPTTKYEEFFSAMCKLGWDIGLAPLNNDRTSKSKSFLKYLDYGMAHIAGIYQGISPLTDVIDNRNGLVANTKEQWFDAICLLVEDQPKREEIVNTALKDIKENHDINFGWQDWYNAYSSLI